LAVLARRGSAKRCTPWGQITYGGVRPRPGYHECSDAAGEEPSAAKYDWMNRIIAIGTGYRRADGPIYNIFEVL